MREQNFQEEGSLSLALIDLGFDCKEKQIAFLQNLEITGCIGTEKIIEAVQLAGHLAPFPKFSYPKSLPDSEPAESVSSPYAERLDLSKEVSVSLKDADQIAESINCSFFKSFTPSFNPSNFLSFVEGDEKLKRLKKNDWRDIFFILSQNAFGRQVGQERYEMKAAEWGKDEELRNLYFSNAEKIGITQRLVPDLKGQKIDFVTVNGASRPGMISRFDSLLSFVSDLSETDAKNLERANFIVLTGEREAWAEIDGIGANQEEKVKEGNSYLLSLAKKRGIELVEGCEFVSYHDGDKVPEGRMKGRTYLNYKSSDGLKIKEADVASDLTEEYTQNLWFLSIFFKSSPQLTAPCLARSPYTKANFFQV